jgi:hypothetical protein
MRAHFQTPAMASNPYNEESFSKWQPWAYALTEVM